MPHGKHGGKRRRKPGGGWEYQYPSQAARSQARAHHQQSANEPHLSRERRTHHAAVAEHLEARPHEPMSPEHAAVVALEGRGRRGGARR